MEDKKIKLKLKDINLTNVKYFKRGRYSQSINYINKGGKEQLTFFDEMSPTEFNKYFTTFKLRLENAGKGHLLKL